MRIYQLSAILANQIAAGEVIERPASVVKELLENSLDAGATAITVEIGYGGLNQIRVSDNGWGILAEDLPLAVATHATSKISTLNDLYAIHTMGFRGEALASIASVAKVSISSRPAEQEHGMMLRIQGTSNDLSPCARNIGTSIDVKDLFFNAPVRKRFLKSEKLEFQAIETVVKRFALSAAQIALTLKHNNKVVLSLPAAINVQAKRLRLAKIFGSTFLKDALYLDVEQGGMALCGWISGLAFQRSQNDRQWVYINQRMIKDKLINHALKQVYEGLLHPGRFPAYLLYFTINPAEVDVNVHPTKHEVRFQQPRLVHDFFIAQLSKTLEVVAADSKEGSHNYLANETANSLAISEPFYDFKPPHRVNTSLLTESKRADGIDVEWPWFVLNKQFIMVLMQQQPYLVDVIALQQFGLFRQLELIDFPLENRPLLVPVRYAIPASLNNNKKQLQQGLMQAGIDTQLEADEQLLIRSVPVKVPYLDIPLFLQSLGNLASFQPEDLRQVISQSQHFDPGFLNAGERAELNALLLHLQEEGKARHCFKALSSDDCRVLLHA